MSLHQDEKVLASGQELDHADKAVIMIHGRGATAQSILQLSEKLPDAAYLAPQATGREWYPEPFMRPVEENQSELDSALEKIDDLVDKCVERVGTENTSLLGFSQGACLVSEYAARNPRKYGGLIIFSGGLIGEKTGNFSGNLEKTEVFIGCAEKDPHIPLERVEQTVEVFEELSAEVDKYVFEGSYHGVVDHEIEKAREIINCR